MGIATGLTVGAFTAGPVVIGSALGFAGILDPSDLQQTLDTTANGADAVVDVLSTAGSAVTDAISDVFDWLRLCKSG